MTFTLFVFLVEVATLREPPLKAGWEGLLRYPGLFFLQGSLHTPKPWGPSVPPRPCAAPSAFVPPPAPLTELTCLPWELGAGSCRIRPDAKHKSVSFPSFRDGDLQPPPCGCGPASSWAAVGAGPGAVLSPGRRGPQGLANGLLAMTPGVYGQQVARTVPSAYGGSTCLIGSERGGGAAYPETSPFSSPEALGEVGTSCLESSGRLALPTDLGSCGLTCVHKGCSPRALCSGSICIALSSVMGTRRPFPREILEAVGSGDGQSLPVHVQRPWRVQERHTQEGHRGQASGRSRRRRGPPGTGSNLCLTNLCPGRGWRLSSPVGAQAALLLPLLLILSPPCSPFAVGFSSSAARNIPDRAHVQSSAVCTRGSGRAQRERFLWSWGVGGLEAPPCVCGS